MNSRNDDHALCLIKVPLPGMPTGSDLIFISYRIEPSRWHVALPGGGPILLPMPAWAKFKRLRREVFAATGIELPHLSQSKWEALIAKAIQRARP